MPRRIFIAIKPTDHIVKKVQTMQEQLAFLPVHWVPPENLHVTLLPPWKSENYEHALKTFSSLKIEKPKIALTFESVQFYKPKNILWAVGRAPEFLGPVIENLRNTFQQPADERKYLMHITLAKHVAAELKVPEVQIDWQFVPEELTLFESLQTETGTEYKTLSSIPLT